MKKRQMTLLILAAGSLLLTGCTEKTKETVTETEVITDSVPENASESELESSLETELQLIYEENVAGWRFCVEDFRRDKSLENVSVELGYTGVETSNYEKEAAEGSEICLIKLLIEKEDSMEEINWDKFRLIDQDGKEYTRMEDEFITDLGMKRMPGTTLNFGSNEGWIAYEIPDATKSLQLVYQFEKESFDCELN